MAAIMKPPTGQAAADLGLGTALTENLMDEDAKRKKLLEDGQENAAAPGSILSPASFALFGNTPRAKIGNM